MGIEIDIACPDRTFMGYLAMPEHKVGPGIVLLHDQFGIHDGLRAKADTLSQKLGMFVLIPDLYWRQQPCLNLNPARQQDQDKARSLTGALDLESGATDTLDTLIALREIGGCTGRVGVLGYGPGARLAFLAAARCDVNASVAYYPAGIDEFLNEAIKITNPMLLHLAGKDEYVSDDTRNKIISSFSDYFMITNRVYPDAQHDFARPGSPTFDRENAALADKRTEEFLAANLAF
jgi:carboxymethylenebutenolidase